MEISFRNEISIESSVNLVYDFLRKMDNFSIWNYAVMSVEPIDGRRSEIYRLTRDLGQSTETETVTIMESRQNRFLHFEAAGGRFPYEMKYELQQAGNRTLLTNDVILKPEGVSRLLLNLFKGNIQSEVKNNLNVLKSIFESNAVNK
ncbi:SRPBCC family protein [Paenibacillus beijingensis]|uniref:Polyketide cyclase n=1 Tax=Paenibacillus beijingensis TaxID=1126833 RepID=A0A0D5NJD0_9BACL|nr:SRPBCC family protein [Paenibacillus beijingensis]AJY75371.1 hypothetical protein VN24_13315 [Paenibacillus beijingensis]